MADASVPPAHKTCTICHETKPIASFPRTGRQCKACVYAKALGRNRANPEKARAREKAWRLRNPEKSRAIKNAWRLANPEKMRARAKAWYHANIERARARQNAKRRANPEKERARGEAQYRKNPEKMLARTKAWRLKNPERYRAREKAWRLKNPEKARAAERAWKRANPEKYRANVKRRRARERHAAITDLTAAQWEMIKAHYGHRCIYCGRKMQRLTQDHIIPLSKGGNHTLSNVVPACRSCNSKKGARAPLIPVQPLLL